MKREFKLKNSKMIKGNFCMPIWTLNHNKTATVEETLRVVSITMVEEEDDEEVVLETEEEDVVTMVTTINEIGRKEEMHPE